MGILMGVSKIYLLAILVIPLMNGSLLCHRHYTTHRIVSANIEAVTHQLPRASSSLPKADWRRRSIRRGLRPTTEGTVSEASNRLEVREIFET